VWSAIASSLGQIGQLQGARQSWQYVIELQNRRLGAAAQTDPYVQLAHTMLQKLGGG
jgi:hypothetical protein